MYNKHMIRYNLYLTKKQVTGFKNLKDGITVSEHLRRAADEYLKRKEPKLIRSPSKGKYGPHNTKPNPQK